MNMTRQYTEFASFYITNVCGLACPGCASFNNYAVKGHYSWETAKERTRRWSELLDLRQISIIGGEPFLHPDLDNWVVGVRDAFRHVDDIQIYTGLTGPSLLRHKDNIRRWLLEHNVKVQISVHSPDWWEESRQTARQILEGLDYTEVDGMDMGSFPQERTSWYDSDGKLLFTMMRQWEFFPSAEKSVVNGKMYFHNNDSEEAHRACLCKDCHYFVDGLLYKCVITGTASMLLEQFSLDDRSKELLSRVKGLDPFTDGFTPFNTSVPQCSLCSTRTKQIIPIGTIPTKKPKVPHETTTT
jgi:4Fe-4S single cluster domain